MTDAPKKDDLSGVETTGHEWDGIEELDNPLPRWWLWALAVSVIWSVGYWIVMPSFPFPTSQGWSYARGVIGYSQREIVLDQIASIEAERAVYRDQIAALPIDEVRQSADLLDVALASGRASFGDNCAACHGSGGQGAKGFPNLNDDDWLWGGTLEDIQATIRHGARWEADDETRYNIMPAFIGDELLSESDVNLVVDYVMSLSGDTEGQPVSEQGALLFEEQCSGCHMEDGSGSTDLGAPNLKDAIWLFGSDRDAVYQTVAQGQNGVMPAWQGRLSEGAINELAIYVHALGGGEQ